MRILWVLCLFAVFTAAAFAQKKPSEDDALLKPNDLAYEDAVKFAQVLDQGGIHVTKIFGSKLNGFFTGVHRAAYYRTDKGVVEAIFFTDDGAEKIHVTETPHGNGYIYSFNGQPHPKLGPGDSFDSPRPMHFMAYRNAFIVIIGNKELFEALKAALHEN